MGKYNCRGTLTPEINQVEKASEYLKQAQAECDRKIAALKDNMSVAGQAKAKDDSLPQWEALQKDIGLQAIELEFRQLEVNYGRDYADYVKMRKLYQSGFSEKAENLCNEIVKQNKSAENVYLASARLLAAKCALRDRRLSPDEQIKRVEAQLEKFIKDQPYGLYRGEAWMELGRIELEQNWDSDAAAKYYGKALEWFRYVRNLNDAMEIYAVPDKVGDVSKPQGKYTSLDQWKRTVYRTENEREIINQKTAPWYLDAKEKECIFLVGFFQFLEGKCDQALENFKKLNSLDSDIALLEGKSIPNILLRLRAACKQGFFVTNKEEHKGLSKSEILKVTFAEMLFILEQFDLAAKIYKKLESPNVTAEAKAFSLLGQADCIRMGRDKSDNEKAMEIYRKIVDDRQLVKTPVAVRALYNCAWAQLYASSKKRPEANLLFEKCVKEFPKSRYAEAALFYLGLINLYYDRKTALQYVASYHNKYPKGIYLERLEQRVKSIGAAKETQGKDSQM